MRNHFVETEGTITESLSDATFKVKLDRDSEVVCDLSRKMRKNFAPVDVGDRVNVALTSYSSTQGCIIHQVAYLKQPEAVSVA
ncbi:MAG: translation initiation factor IF-1 [Cyanobacteria bacterium J06626_18]